MKANEWLVTLAVIAMTALLFTAIHAQPATPTLTATWISTNTARVAWSAGGCVDRQRGQARTRVACTDSADARDTDAAAGDVFILEYNDSVHGQGEVDTTLAALCGAFLPQIQH